MNDRLMDDRKCPKCGREGMLFSTQGVGGGCVETRIECLNCGFKLCSTAENLRKPVGFVEKGLNTLKDAINSLLKGDMQE